MNGFSYTKPAFKRFARRYTSAHGIRSVFNHTPSFISLYCHESYFSSFMVLIITDLF